LLIYCITESTRRSFNTAQQTKAHTALLFTEKRPYLEIVAVEGDDVAQKDVGGLELTGNRGIVGQVVQILAALQEVPAPDACSG
jgi:hypothetical protein